MTLPPMASLDLAQPNGSSLDAVALRVPLDSQSVVLELTYTGGTVS